MENVADFGTEPLSKDVIAKRCASLVNVNMAEKRFKVQLQDVVMCWDSGSMQNRKVPHVRDGDRTVCSQFATVRRRDHKEPAAAEHRAGDHGDWRNV